MTKSFLQTNEWLDFQHELGRHAWRYCDSGIHANIIKHELPYGKNYLYVPYGPEVAFEQMDHGLRNSVKNFFSNILTLAEANNSMFIKIEPMSDMVSELIHGKRGFRTGRHLQPHKTIVLDITQSEEELLERMHHKARYNIKLSEKKNLVFTESKDIELFWSMLKDTAHHDGFSTHGMEYYENLLSFFEKRQNIKTRLYIVEHKEKSVAGAIVLEYANTAYYLHGAMDRKGRTLMAPHHLHWNIIKEYKKRGLSSYDFWGIDADQWPGVTRFKHGFGGRVVEYPGAFDLPVSGFWYSLYRLSRRLRRR